MTSIDKRLASNSQDFHSCSSWLYPQSFLRPFCSRWTAFRARNQTRDGARRGESSASSSSIVPQPTTRIFIVNRQEFPHRQHSKCILFISHIYTGLKIKKKKIIIPPVFSESFIRYNSYVDSVRRPVVTPAYIYTILVCHYSTILIWYHRSTVLIHKLANFNDSLCSL